MHPLVVVLKALAAYFPFLSIHCKLSFTLTHLHAHIHTMANKMVACHITALTRLN